MSSIPERLARIVRHKFNEVKEHIERLDEEAQLELETEQKRLQSRADARRELNDSVNTPRAFDPETRASSDSAPASTSSGTRLRSPEEIAGGLRSVGQPVSTPSAAATAAQHDPLLYHYRLLGVEPGGDFPTVQAAYNRLAARCDPARFPAGSQEEQEAKQIRDRLETSYKALREALDPTARRFGMLDFDSPKPPTS
jgi:hypothetical protein